MQCLGLDIGSSTIKGAILDLESGAVHSITREPFPEPVPGLPTGWFEVDPSEIVARPARSFRSCCSRLRRRSRYSCAGRWAVWCWWTRLVLPARDICRGAISGPCRGRCSRCKLASDRFCQTSETNSNRAR